MAEPCATQVVPHDWRVAVGGPFGYLYFAEDGAIQVCARCGSRRQATSVERRGAVQVAELLAERDLLVGVLRRLTEACDALEIAIQGVDFEGEAGRVEELDEARREAEDAFVESRRVLGEHKGEGRTT